MVTSNDKLTTTQKETCAVISMRDAAALMAREEQISYEDSLLLYASSRIYDGLFDFDTGIWKESPEYLLDLYNKFADKKLA